ncbi:hypothetical protein FWK35_00004936 [Aphis craccivora]|uniref:Uncharacterized protein n=1 Tax=Aphis craccivora TaxID=307492 RepID=A0A6G0ZFC3_APHCR|nr:hypothetical protein FWK35_00004936 [Aphis craccivora]
MKNMYEDNFMKGDNLIKALLNTKRKDQLKQISDYNYNRYCKIIKLSNSIENEKNINQTDKFESLKNEKLMQKELLKRIRNIEARNSKHQENVEFERSLLDKLKENQNKFLKEEINKLLNISETKRSKNKVPTQFMCKFSITIKAYH